MWGAWGAPLGLLLLLLPTTCRGSKLLDDTVLMVQAAKTLHRRDFAEGAGTAAAKPAKRFILPTREVKCLVFIPVSSGEDVQELVRDNVGRLRDASRIVTDDRTKLRFDVYLVHYDHGAEAWKSNKTLTRWYKKNVKFTLQRSGLKFVLGKDILVTSVGQPYIRDYDWVWLLDEDADLTSMNLGGFIDAAERSQSLIVAPTITFQEDDQRDGVPLISCGPGDPKCRFQSPNRECSYRHVNFVEMSYPMFRPDAWSALARAEGTVLQRSAWGLDHIWCGLVPGVAKRGNKSSACALIDAAPIVHRNLQPPASHENVTLTRENHIVFRRMKDTFPAFFMQRVKTYRCAP